MRTKETCGCKHDGIYWLEMCPPHRAEADAIAQRWAAERENPPVPIHTNYHGQAKPTDWLEVPSGSLTA